MAYLQGDYQLPERRVDEEIRLFVDNLPEELDTDGIAQLFKSYGEISSLLSPPGAKYAFVGYKSYREAEHAIRALNERSPLSLRVSFSRKKQPENPQKYVPPVDIPVNDFHMREYRHPTNGINHNGIPRKVMPNQAHFAQYPNFNPGMEPEHSVYPYDMDHTMYNPYESAGRYANANAMWSNRCINIDEQGTRYVSGGRGYTRYNIPEPHPKLEDQLRREYEIRQLGLYQYGVDPLKSDIGKCQYCTNVTKIRCEKCNGFYCSRECQIADWPRHKMECKPIPDLIGDTGMYPLSRSSSEDQLLVPRRPAGTDLRPPGPLRRPKRIIEKINANANHEQSVIQDAQPIKNDSIPSNEEIRNGIPKTNSPIVREEAFQKFPPRSPIRNGNNVSQTISNGDGILPIPNEIQSFNHQHYDEKINDGNNNQNGKQGNATLFDQKAAEKLRPAVFSDGSSGPKELRRKGSQTGSLLNLAKEDLMKMEEELAFTKDPRALANVENQEPVFAEVYESQGITPAALVENVTNAASTYIGRDLSKDEFTPVIIVFGMPDGTFWVHKESDAAELGQMMLDLNVKANGYPQVTEIMIGEIYAVKYEDFWHRVSIVSIQPPEVFYLDYGNAESPQSDDFRSLKDYPNYPPFAMRVRFANISKDKPVNADDRLLIKMINIDKDSIIDVLIQDATEETASVPVKSANTEVIPQTSVTNVDTSKGAIPKVASPTVQSPKVIAVVPPKEVEIPKEPAIKLPSLVYALEVNSEGFIQIYMALNDKSYAVCVLGSDFQEQFQLIYEQLSIDCTTAVKPQDFRPQVGDFVCGKREEDWLRGYVFSVGPPTRLALIDEARIAQVEELLPMPEKYKDICSFGSICTFDNVGSKFEVNENAQFRVTDIKDVAGERVVRAIIVESEHLNNVGVTLKNWKPTPEQKGISFAELKPNTEVCITAYISERIMFVRSLDAETLERSQRIIQNVAKWALTAPPLDGPPAIGQLVIAKYSDGNFYRAIVTKIIDGKIGVSYVDYGNREITTMDQLRMLSDELKEQKSCAAKIMLKGVNTSDAPTKEVHQYLDILVGKEQPLFCTFEGIPSKDGVILTTATGECINTRVNELLTPSWKQCDPSRTPYAFMLDDFHFASLGEVGKVVQAIVLHATEPPFKYVMSPVDQEIISHVTDTMATKMLEYCESTKERYIPRVGELCIAIYYGQWYRGVCLNRSETENQSRIQFIDYGNVELVDHKDIRSMTKEFNDVPGLGCTCTVKNLGIELVNNQVPANIKARLDELIQLENFIDVLILNESDGDYEIELPEVKKTLIAEGLVKL